MFRILDKNRLADDTTEYVISAPAIARKAQAGQFVVVRLHEKGERIPLTIADMDREKGTITLVVLEIGKTTKEMATFERGDDLHDIIGPLGKPSEIEHYGTVVCVGGGVGIAAIYPITRALKNKGNKIISIIGARTKSRLFYEEKMRTVSDELYVTTDDGSYGIKGFVTTKLKEILDSGAKIDLVFAVGPAIMMKFVAKTTEPYGVKTIVSLNPIMVDGTGMCGGCRVSVGGKTMFACVDGPDFDAHQVDFDELLARQSIYLEEEKISMEQFQRRCGHGS